VRSQNSNDEKAIRILIINKPNSEGVARARRREVTAALDTTKQKYIRHVKAQRVAPESPLGEG